MILRFLMTQGCMVSLCGGELPGLVNTLCLCGISITNLKEATDGSWIFETEAGALQLLQAEAAKRGAEVHVLRKRGVRHFLRRFRFRRLLLCVLLLLFALTGWFSTHIWEIRVSGNRILTKGEILDALESVGVYPGVSCFTIDNPKVRSYLQELLPELSWCTVQVHGSRAVVLVRERRERPRIVDEDSHVDLIAKRSAVVDFVSVLEGKPLVRKGELVLAGQTLVTGTLTDRQAETRQVHALGEVWALTWYEKTMAFPLKTAERIASGDVKVRYALKICDFRLNFYRDGGNSGCSYDKIETEYRPAIGGLHLPLSVVRTERREYGLREWNLDETAAEGLLRERLLRWLQLETDGAVQCSAEFESAAENGVLFVTLHAVCREQIAAEQPSRTDSAMISP